MLTVWSLHISIVLYTSCLYSAMYNSWEAFVFSTCVIDAITGLQCLSSVCRIKRDFHSHPQPSPSEFAKTVQLNSYFTHRNTNLVSSNHPVTIVPPSKWHLSDTYLIQFFNLNTQINFLWPQISLCPFPNPQIDAYSSFFKSAYLKLHSFKFWSKTVPFSSLLYHFFTYQPPYQLILQLSTYSFVLYPIFPTHIFSITITPI